MGLALHIHHHRHHLQLWNRSTIKIGTLLVTTESDSLTQNRGPLYGVMAVYHRRQADVHLPGHEHINLSPLSPL